MGSVLKQHVDARRSKDDTIIVVEHEQAVNVCELESTKTRL